jgi:hypothetical protein
MTTLQRVLIHKVVAKVAVVAKVVEAVIKVVLP